MKFTKEQIAELIIKFIKEYYTDNEISVSDTLASLGVDSLGFLELFMTLEESLNLEKIKNFTPKDYHTLFNRVILEKWTIEKLAEHIESFAK